MFTPNKPAGISRQKIRYQPFSAEAGSKLVSGEKLRLVGLLQFFALLLSQVSMAQSPPLLPREPQAQVADQILGLGMQMDKTAFDCSHFVNYLFQKVGLDYDYEPSRVFYRGTEEFKHVSRPVPGDLIVWPGHVGIVVDPEAKTFLSALRRGVSIASYTSSYWRRRGRARFFRYSSPSNQRHAWEAGSWRWTNSQRFGAELGIPKRREGKW